MKRRSPPWGAIEAFIVASRAASFKDAASQLALSPPAFSRRIQALEDHVGVKLFDRCTPTPALTGAGRSYLQRLKPGYEAMRAATDWMSPDPGQRPLRIGVSQSFAVSWLVPRLPRFQAQVPEVEVVLQTCSRTVDVLGGAADIRILFGTGDWDQLSVQKLFGLTAFPVCAPRLADGRAPPRSLAELASHRLLDPGKPASSWDRWLSEAGYRGAAPDCMPFDSLQVMYEAAAQGLGVALGVAPFVDRFLDGQRLQIAIDLALPMEGAYYIAALPEMRRQPAVQQVWRWLLKEAAEDAYQAAPLRKAS